MVRKGARFPSGEGDYNILNDDIFASDVCRTTCVRLFFQRKGESGKNGAMKIPAAPIADRALGSSANPSSSPDFLLPPLPPTASEESEDSVRVSSLSDELEVAELQSGSGDADTADGEESVEDLLSSLMRTLNTEQGRAEFRLLASNDSTRMMETST